MKDIQNNNLLFAQGDKASSEYFTGSAWVNLLVPQDETGHFSVGNVLFEPGCRNNWHTHTAGQILIITDGKGFYQEKGKQARNLSKGDVVVIPSHVEHWHGATKGSSLSHIVITSITEQGAVEWLAPVTDEEYTNCHAPIQNGGTKLTLTEAAIRNHEELFSNHVSSLQVTDPEFIGLFDNFAFDDVLSYGSMDTKTRVMLILASTIAGQALSEFTVMAKAALHAGVSPIELKEIVYQAVPYVGIAKTLDFIHATNEILMQKGISLPLEGQSTTTRADRFEKGLAKQKEIFGQIIDDLHEKSPEGQRHIQEFLSANCFGDYYTRNGLSVKMRELLTFALLISLGGADAQVKAHVQGNKNIGNDKALLVNVVTQLLPYIGYPRSLNAIKCINDITPD